MKKAWTHRESPLRGGEKKWAKQKEGGSGGLSTTLETVSPHWYPINQWVVRLGKEGMGTGSLYDEVH